MESISWDLDVNRWRKLNLVALLVLEEVYPFTLREVVEPKDGITGETWTFHHAIILEFVRRNDRSTFRARVGGYVHR